MWTLPMFFPFPNLSLLPIPITISTQTNSLIFFPVELPLLFGNFCLSWKLSRIPGNMTWDTGRWPHLHTRSPKFCFGSPWLLLSKSARSPGQNTRIWSRGERITEGETRKNNGKGNQKVWHPFQPGSVGICGAVSIVAVSPNTGAGKEMDFPLQLNWENKPEERKKEEEKQADAW